MPAQLSLRLATTLSLMGLTATTARADGGAAERAQAESRVVHEAAPWARIVEGELSKPLFEQLYGAQAEAARQRFQPYMQDGVMYDRDSWTADMFTALGIPPLRAESYEAAVGVLFVATEGVTLRPTCGNGDSANAALDCSPLVDVETVFAPAGGGGAGLFQELAGYYEPFNLVMTTNRPPEYLPYTMAVVGGSAGQVGLQGACGVANVACDGLKRNHVSLTFPESCGGSAGTAAQETAHNWGLEHTSNPSDLMYPFNMGGSQSFVDNCMTISNATGNGVTQCGYVHETYCPDGMGEQQNSYGELMGVFGPRVVDTVDPEIVSMSPANGSVFSTSDTFLVTAKIDDNSRMLGVRWTWIEGLPPEIDGLNKCTNNVCDSNFVTGAGFDPAEVNWDFITLSEPPVGVYSFQLEVLDAYGNAATETITFEVTADGNEGGADAGADEGALDDTGGGGSDEAGGVGGGTTGAEPTASGTGVDGQADGDDLGDSGPEGCACRLTRGGDPTLPWPGPMAMFGLLVVARGRRRPVAK